MSSKFGQTNALKALSNQHTETPSKRLRSKYEIPFKPIRFAREYSVLKTACPALCNALDPESIREAVRHLTGGGTAHTGIILSNILP